MFSSLYFVRLLADTWLGPDGWVLHADDCIHERCTGSRVAGWRKGVGDGTGICRTSLDTYVLVAIVIIVMFVYGAAAWRLPVCVMRSGVEWRWRWRWRWSGTKGKLQALQAFGDRGTTGSTEGKLTN